MVLKYSSVSSIPHLENIIATVLNESSKHEQTSNMSSFLKVFQMILFRIDKWNGTTKPAVRDASTKADSIEVELRRNWLKLVSTDNRIDEDDAKFDKSKFREEQEQKLKETDDTVDEEEKKEQLPPHLDVAVQIMKRLIKYISTKSQMDKCVVLESIVCGLNILKVTENQLLPIVHLIWKPFVERFKESDPIVLRRCFQLLMKLGEVSKDFIYQRTAK